MDFRKGLFSSQLRKPRQPTTSHKFFSHHSSPVTDFLIKLSLTETHVSPQNLSERYSKNSELHKLSPPRFILRQMVPQNVSIKKLPPISRSTPPEILMNGPNISP